MLVLARSESSAQRARASVEKTLHRLGAEIDPQHVQVVTDPGALATARFVVEAVVEELDVKAGLLEDTPVVAPKLAPWQRELITVCFPGLKVIEFAEPIVRLGRVIYADSMNHFLHRVDGLAAEMGAQGRATQLPATARKASIATATAPITPTTIARLRP